MYVEPPSTMVSSCLELQLGKASTDNTDYANCCTSYGYVAEMELIDNYPQSHINSTETENAISTITKTSAPSKKAIVSTSGQEMLQNETTRLQEERSIAL